MLVPALSRKEEVLQEFSKIIYDDKYFYYSGYRYCHGVPNISDADNWFQWASIGSRNQVIGFIAYNIDDTEAACKFKIISFDEGNAVFIRDLSNILTELLTSCRRLEWRCVSGNPIMKHYSKFCFDHKGNEVVLHDVCRDNHGNYCDEHIYEIVRNRDISSKLTKPELLDRITTYIK